jgi:hypothetical protein
MVHRFNHSSQVGTLLPVAIYLLFRGCSTLLEVLHDGPLSLLSVFVLLLQVS